MTVNHLQQRFGNTRVAVLYVYCDYKDRDNQTDKNLIASLAKQSIMQQSDMPGQAKSLYSECRNGEVSASFEQYLDLLTASMRYFQRTFVVIDALDEHLVASEGIHGPNTNLLSTLKKIQQTSANRCMLLITTRVKRSAQDEPESWAQIEIRARDEDIRSFVNGGFLSTQNLSLRALFKMTPAWVTK
jgi:hypothetical protein